jgi:YVTN family beta-propeller protein
VWVARGPAGLAQVDPMTGEVLMEIPTDASYVAVGGGSVWTTTNVAIERWDAITGDQLASIPADVAEFTELLYAHDALWVTAKEDGLLLRVDPASNTVVATIETGAGAHGIAADAAAIWVTNYRANTVSRVDPSTNEVAATVARVGSGVGIAAGGGAIWVSTQGTGISRIDPMTNEASLVISLPFEWNYGVAVDAGTIWVSSVEMQSVYRYEIADLGT